MNDTDPQLNDTPTSAAARDPEPHCADQLEIPALDLRRHLVPHLIKSRDAHKRSHTAVIIDGNGRKLATKACKTTSKDHLSLLQWAAGHGPDRVWALEDCRNMTRRLERDLLGAGERIVRVPPKLMAHARDAAPAYGKSDPIDAPAVARAALREDDLPTAHLDGPGRHIDADRAASVPARATSRTVRRVEPGVSLRHWWRSAIPPGRSRAPWQRTAPG